MPDELPPKLNYRSSEEDALAVTIRRACKMGRGEVILGRILRCGVAIVAGFGAVNIFTSTRPKMAGEFVLGLIMAAFSRRTDGN